MLESTERPPIATTPLSVILIAPDDFSGFQERANAWTTFLAGRVQEHEILLVKRGASKDSGLGGSLPATPQLELRVLESQSGGIGAALRVGLAAAQHPLVYYTLAGEYEPADLELLLKWIDRVDLVSGYRVWPDRSLGRRLAAAAGRWLLRVLFAVRLRDVNCWAVLARRSIFARLPIQSEGVFAQAEVLAKANFLGCIMTEVPVQYRPVPGTQRAAGACFMLLREGWRVLAKPDFGPALLPESAPPAIPEAPPASLPG